MTASILYVEDETGQIWVYKQGNIDKIEGLILRPSQTFIPMYQADVFNFAV
jgi:hypothetical protein